ncbi:putative 50S ribosomal subunit protein L27 [Candidatus Hodgkinia cicadicola Dsem]|nr:putative 50S ribosomal subunit protein L27 [Candidatus Hodgkinia cicadicola Dsem]
MAHKKASGASRNGRESRSKRLGIKAYGGRKVKPGSVIVKQRGTRWRASSGCALGRDHSVMSTKAGVVRFESRSRTVKVEPEAC